MEGSLFHHSVSVFVVLCSLPLFSFTIFFFLHTNTTVNFKLVLVHHKRGFFFFPPPLPTATNPSIKTLLCSGLLSQRFSWFFFFKLFVLSHIFISTFPRFQPPFPLEHRCCPELFHNLADAVPPVLVLWWQEVKALWINASDSPPFFFPHLFCFPPSGQTVFMLLDERKKKKRERELLHAATF